MDNPYFETYGDCEKAWDEAIAARDKWWLEWLLTNLFRETDYGLEFREPPKYALLKLAELKQSILEAKE